MFWSIWYHPEQCLVGKSSVILDGWEHAEDQADQHGEEPDDDDRDYHVGDDNHDKHLEMCVFGVYQDIFREKPHFRGNRD